MTPSTPHSRVFNKLRTLRYLRTSRELPSKGDGDDAMWISTLSVERAHDHESLIPDGIGETAMILDPLKGDPT